jgi:hypothetical protein
MDDNTIDYRLAANIQIPLAQALGWWHSVNPHYDFVEALVRSAYELGPSMWEAPDWVLAQIAEETGNGLSDLALRFNNFGGIGVSGQTSPNPKDQKPAVPTDGSNDWLWALYKGKYQWVAGLSKPDVVQGVEMVIAHRKAYTDPNYNYWAAARDPRYNLARNNRIAQVWPVATTIDYFGSGKWAADPTGYGQKCINKFKLMQSWKG